MIAAPAPVPVEPPAPPAPASRAGRDLKAAFSVAVVLGVIIIGTLLIKKESFLFVIAIAAAIGVWELRGVLRQVGVAAPLVPPVVGAGAMVWAAWHHGPAGLLTAWVLTCVAVVLWRGSGALDGAGRDVLGGAFIATYPPLLIGFAALLLAADDGVGRMFVFIITTVCSDTGGYIAGVLFGKHPMAPTISPKKSWEGFAGSVLLSVVGGALTVHFFLGHSWWIGVALGVGVAVAATIGDLMESLIKRDLGVKDMSTLLPGHGGFMDRLDSLVVVVPIVWAVLTLLAEKPV